ncbi:MAG TPA: hypothetical protein VJC18_05585, partial [bacterium]|nr:hypothetical protein [bacterium]
SELQQQEQVSLAAQSSLAGAKEQDTSKKQTDVSPESGLGQSPDKQSRTDRAVEKSALELLGSESFETRKQTPEPVPTVAPARRAKQFLRQYTFSELMLFGFGALVILVIIIVFAVLFL